MDDWRTWIVRIAAPVAFVAAAVVLVIVIKTSIDDSGSGDAIPPATLPDTVLVTTSVDTGASTDVGEPVYYRVKEGDTLEGIAAGFGTTVDQLLALNPDITDPLAIQPGQRIRVA